MSTMRVIATHGFLGQYDVILFKESKHKYSVKYGKHIKMQLSRAEALKEYAECIEHQIECDGGFD